MKPEELTARLEAIFLDELDDVLSGWDRAGLELEAAPDDATREALVRSVFRTAHSLKGAARAAGVRAVEHVCHELEAELVEVREGKRRVDRALIERWLRTGDALRDSSRTLRAGGRLESIPELRGATPPPPGRTSSTPPPPPPPQNTSTREVPAGLRVAAAKLDLLVARIADLQHAVKRAETRREQAEALRDTLSRTAGVPSTSASNAVAAARAAAEQLAISIAADERALRRATHELLGMARRLRMVPFGEVRDGLERAARDVAAVEGKEVSLILEGADVELDRAVLDALRDPLRHLVRNAVHHGIEPPAERIAQGKPSRGRLQLGASLRGSHVEVAVSDDGAGIDVGALRRLSPDRPEGDLARTIFEPGVSTSMRVSEVGGRGVGLDVVKTRTEWLQGRVAVDTRPGQGTRFVMTVPVSLATSSLLLVRAANATFALDVGHVARIDRVSPESISTTSGRLVAQPGSVAIAWLAAVLGLEPQPDVVGAAPLMSIVMGPEPSSIGFVVDEVLGVEELVVRALGPRLRNAVAVRGAASLPDGGLALVLARRPLLRAAAARMGGAPSIPDSSRPRAFRVLVVDDSPTTRDLARSILLADGYDVVTASDGLQAWRMLEASELDILVSDVEIPGLNGVELVRAVRSSPRLSTLPVVLLTALGSDADRLRGEQAGADAYLVKSRFDQTELLATLQRLRRDPR